jgi:hypothetical protein
MNEPKTWTEADEAAWHERYQAKRAAEEAVFQARDYQPPRHSQVNGPPLDWRRWNALLDGKPVGSCWAFDADEGWVEVWMIVKKNPNGSVTRAKAARRRLYGAVTPVSLEEWQRMKDAQGEVLEVWADQPFGELVPGTEPNW